jgi:hypothetical protein
MRVLKILLLVMALWAPYASADVSLPGNGTQPVKVNISIFILDLDGIDDVNQTFQANLFIWPAGMTRD